MEGVFLAIMSSLATIMCVQLLVPLAVRVGFLDVAKGHKNHEGEVPPIGGLAMFMGLVFVQVIWSTLGQEGFLSFGIMSAASLLILIGALDDRFALPINLRFVAQVFSILIIAFSPGTVLDSLGRMISPSTLELGIIAFPVTVFAAVAVINGMNFVDGIDGLAGGLAAVSMLLIAAMAMIGGCTNELFVCLAMLGCVVGFLAFNLRCFGRPRARVFMGDAGSMFLGLMLASLLISLSQGSHPPIPPALSLWILALPLLNLVGVIGVRLSAGKSPFQADRLHVHHICLDAGYTVNQALIVIVGLHALIGILGIVAFAAHVPEYVLFYGFSALVACYTLISRKPIHLKRALRYLHPRVFRYPQAECDLSAHKTPLVRRVSKYSWSGIFDEAKHAQTNRPDSLPLQSCPSKSTE